MPRILRFKIQTETTENRNRMDSVNLFMKASSKNDFLNSARLSLIRNINNLY